MLRLPLQSPGGEKKSELTEKSKESVCIVL